MLVCVNGVLKGPIFQVIGMMEIFKCDSQFSQPYLVNGGISIPYDRISNAMQVAK